MNSSDSQLTFEQSLAELERAVRDLEDGQLGLDEALARYEAGVNLLKRCYAQLRQVEQRIVLVTGVNSSGDPVVQPFEHAATAEPGGTDVSACANDGSRPKKKNLQPEIPF
jgi:exodeoxyribonuclease VII small subunit